MRATVIALVAGLLLGTLAGWVAQGWRADAAMAQARQQHAETLRDISEKSAAVAAAVRKAEQAANTAINEADKAATKRIADAKQETDRLRACVAAGTCGVRIKTVYVRDSSSGGSADTSSRTVGDAALELDAETGLRVLDLRESIQLDAEKLSYLQQYARQCWSAGAEVQSVVP